jgi:hypothetical protein
MDEVGRGTSVSTALAIAFATVHHLYTHNQCRALFATHFHEIADMLGYDEVTQKAQGFFKNIAFYCTDVDELEVGVDCLLIFSPNTHHMIVERLFYVLSSRQTWGKSRQSRLEGRPIGRHAHFGA